MSWAWRFRMWEHLSTALWPVPCAFGLAGLLLGMAVWRLDRWGRWALFDFDHGGATALLAAIVGASLTFMGTAFSVLLVVVQFASTQLSPRALRVSLSDPLYKVTLGLFVTTFLYAMVILGRTTATFVPQLGLSLAAVLIAASLVAYVILISHLRRSMRPVVVAARVGEQGRRTLARVYPHALDSDGPTQGPPPTATAGPTASLAPTRTIANPWAPGILVAFDARGLVAEARRCNARIALVPALGDFVRRRGPLFSLWEPAHPVDERCLRDSVVLGQDRTLGHDPAFAFRVLVDVALKALSPAMNDPTSAVMAIDQLHDLLAYLSTRRLDIGLHCDADGQARLVTDVPSWDDFVSLAIDEIRRFGAGQPQVARRLRAVFEDLLRVVPDARKAAVRRELDLLTQSVQRTFETVEDRARASEADPQGIGSSPHPTKSPD
jgi:uncharacterized membrane protein